MGEPPPSTNLWVGDLPPDTDKELLASVFEAYGTIVESRVMPPRHSGQKACAMVRFSSLEEATWIVDNVNGNIPSGLAEPIVVRYANNPGGGGSGGPKPWASTPVQPGPSRVAPAGGKANAGGDPPPSANLWVGDLPPDLTQENLQAIFEAYGTVTNSKVLPPKQPGQNASAMVRFGSIEEASWVVENVNGNVPQGLESPVIVRYANAPRGPAAGGFGGAIAGGGGKGWATAAATAASRAVQRTAPYGDAAAVPAINPKAAGLRPMGKGGATWGAGIMPGKGFGKTSGPGSAQTLVYAARKAGILGGGTVPIECQVYIKNLPRDMSDLDLFRLFAPFGPLAPSGCTVMTHEDGSCKGFGFVDFVDADNANLAVTTLNGFTTLDGGQIFVSLKVKKGKPEGEEKVGL